MYRHPLERLLIYTDKENRQEFNITDEAWYELYELFVTTKYDVLDDEFSAVDFFNEVFYELTYTYANEDAAERINEYLTCYSPICPPPPPEWENPTTRAERESAKDYNDKLDDINHYILGFVWFILKKQKNLPKPVELFLSALDKMIDVEKYDYDFYPEISEYLDTHHTKYSFSFPINPQFVLDIALRPIDEWKEATLDFDKEIVAQIVYRFRDKDDREPVIKELQRALKKANEDPKSHRIVSMKTHRKKANDDFLNELFQEAENNPDSFTQIEQQNVIMKEGFAEFILRDHQKVLNLLMLIAHLGKGQMPLLIKCIRALQSLGYMDKDCLKDVEQFVRKASPQFESLNFDLTNVTRQINMSSKRGDKEYNAMVSTIAKYIEVVITG